MFTSNPVRRLSQARIWNKPTRRLTVVRNHESSGVTFMLHDLRRTFLTIADTQEISAYAIKKLANHRTQNDVTAGYIVADVERLREPMDRISKFIMEKVGPGVLVSAEKKPKVIRNLKTKTVQA